MNIYAGNLTYDITEEQLKAEFATFGEVVSVSIPNDKYTGRPRGFAFVEMSKVAEGQAAIKGLNGKEFKGRTLTVSEARPRSDNRGGTSYGDRRGGDFNRGRQRRY